MYHLDEKFYLVLTQLKMIANQVIYYIIQPLIIEIYEQKFILSY